MISRSPRMASDRNERGKKMKIHQLRITSESVFCGSLILVNAKYPLRDKREPSELSVVLDSQPQMRMRREAAQALGALITASENAVWQPGKEMSGTEGRETDHIVCVSGYRSRQEQENIFERSLLKNGREFTRTYVAYPGCSEHETGLAMDLAKEQDEIDFICPEFPYDGIFGVFRSLAPEFGFVERYPADGTGRTGIGAEPWHFRYVGTPHARIMAERGMVLEEYVEWIRKYKLQENPFLYCAGGKTATIGYQRISSSRGIKDICIDVPENGNVSVSGDNAYGVIVTVEAGMR